MFLLPVLLEPIKYTSCNKLHSLRRHSNIYKFFSIVNGLNSAFIIIPFISKIKIAFVQNIFYPYFSALI